MTDLTLFGLKNCDTCRKALTALEAAGHSVVVVDIRNEADLAAKIPVWIAAAGVDALVNKRSTTWRNFSAEEKQQADHGGAADLLIANPTLIKRPVIERDDRVYIGWGKDVSTQLT